MRRSFIDRAAWGIVGALSLLLVATLAGVVRGGPLDPTGSPSSTLPQVEPRVPIRQPASAAGFPIVIGTPGSYFLTQDIVGAAGNDGISIATDDVTIDLNGFTVDGGAAGANGISASGAFSHLVISGGTVRRWTGVGVKAGQVSGGRYDGLIVESNTGGGIEAGADSIVTGCIARGNGGNGVLMSSASAIGASIVRGCVVESSVLDGIQVANNVLVTDNSLSNNSVNDIHVTGGGNRLDGNNIVKTGDKAIKVDVGATNVIIRNSVQGVLSDIDIASGNAKGPSETAGTPLGNPWANIVY